MTLKLANKIVLVTDVVHHKAYGYYFAFPCEQAKFAFLSILARFNVKFKSQVKNTVFCKL